MPKRPIEPVVLPDVHDPHVPLSDLLPNPPKEDDAPAEDADSTAQQPTENPATGHRQPQKQPQTQPLDPEVDRDVGGGD